MYLPSPPSQLVLFVLDNAKNIERNIRVTCSLLSQCMSKPSQLACLKFALSQSRGLGDLSVYLQVRLVNHMIKVRKQSTGALYVVA